MKGFAKWLVRHRALVILVCLVLMIPSALGMAATQTKYDLLYYLPQDLETVRGQEILLQDFGKGAFSLLITEGMYGCADGLEKAVANKHMTMQEAAALAREAGVRQLWLTHFSPSEHNVTEYRNEIRAIFEDTVISDDGQRTDLAFSHEEKDND